MTGSSVPSTIVYIRSSNDLTTTSLTKAIGASILFRGRFDSTLSKVHPLLEHWVLFPSQKLNVFEHFVKVSGKDSNLEWYPAPKRGNLHNETLINMLLPWQMVYVQLKTDHIAPITWVSINWRYHLSLHSFSQ